MVGTLIEKLSTVIQKFVAFLELKKILGKNLLLQTDILQKTVVGCPWTAAIPLLFSF